MNLANQPAIVQYAALALVVGVALIAARFVIHLVRHIISIVLTLIVAGGLIYLAYHFLIK